MRGKFSHGLSGVIPLDGGVDEYHDPIEVADNRKLSAVNIHIDGGKLKKRPGRALWSSVAFPATFQGVHEYVDANGVERVLVACDGDIKEVDATSATDRDTGLTAEKLRFQTYRGRCWYNGATTQRKITETTAARVGVVAPTGAPTVTHDSTGLTGAYLWKYTFVIEVGGVKYWESDPSPALAHTLANENALIACDASADTRVTHRYVYRTTAGGSLYQYAGKIADNLAASTFDDTVADAALGAVLETNHGVPEQGQICQGANERMFWIDDDKLRWSEMAHTEAYLEYQEATNFKELPKYGLGTGLRAVYNVNAAKEDLYVFQLDSTNILSGADPNTPLHTLNSQRGCISHDTIVEWNGSPIFLTNQKTVEIVIGGRLVDITSRNIPVSMAKLITPADASAGLLWGNYYALCCRTDNTKGYNDQVWICDLRTVREVQPGQADATWYRWDVDAQYIMERKDGTILVFDNNAKSVFTLGTSNYADTDADGVTSAIEATWQTKDFTKGLHARLHPRTLVIKGRQMGVLQVTPYYGNNYRGTDVTVFSTSGGSVFVMGQSLMGSRVTHIPLKIEGKIPSSIVGAWVSFLFTKSVTDNYFELTQMQYSYTLYQRQ